MQKERNALFIKAIFYYFLHASNALTVKRQKDKKG